MRSPMRAGLPVLYPLCMFVLGCQVVATTGPTTIKYARFQVGKTVAYGVVEGDAVRQISGDPFGEWRSTGTVYPLDELKLLPPVRPGKVLALAGNYVSHLGDEHPRPEHPEVFFKVPSCIIGPGESVVIPKHSSEVHLEAEMVIVIGRRAKNVPEEEALKYVLGVTCGNDISARDWQSKDRQWWRAKGTDTFGPCGPFIVSGIDYDDLLLQSRLNGEIKQSQRTSDMVFSVPQTVSWISRHVTLEPGDLIYTGTPGKTPAIRPGDVLDIELEQVGVLRNGVVAEP